MTWKEKSPRAASRGSRRVALWAFLFACPTLLLMTSGGAVKSDTVATLAGESSDGYVGSQACSACHQGIYQQFTKTSMGRSMSLVTPAFLQKASLPSRYFNERLDRLFEVYSQDGKLYQSESATGSDGKESFRDVHQLEWVIGSGVNGFGGLLRKDGYLFQAPLSFYSHPMTWEPSPGYEFIDLGFSRPITPGCIFCHSGRPSPVTGTNGQFDSKPFSQLAIGCESCHGPGAAHIQAMSGGRLQTQTKAAPIDAHIVNPAHLTPYLADNICMGCHQNGDARVLKPGKTYQDFRPGRPLDDTLSILMVPPQPESPPTADHVEHYYSMTLSKCYRASGGRLRCITCHDPHVEPSREEAPAYFAAKCLTCHTNQSCKLPIETRMQQKPANNCIGCHMPKRDIQVISHSSATNHRILARPDEPFPDFAFHQTTASLPDLIHINPAPGQQAVPPPLLTLLAAYGELTQKHPEYVAAYLKVLDRLEQTQPDEPLVQAALGRRDLQKGDYQAAAVHLRRAVEKDATTATTYSDLADALAHLGDAEQAISLLEKAIDLDPFNPWSRKMLILGLIQAKQYAKAETALEQYSGIFPQDDLMRKALARARANSPQP
jgi:Tfp pilus assembly protein PilF